MEIQYLQKLRDNPTRGRLTNMTLVDGIIGIEHYEKYYNNGNPLPKVLRELLFLAGGYCTCLDYGENRIYSLQLMQQRISEDLKEVHGLVITRPHFFVDAADPHYPLFMFLDEGDNPPLYQISFKNDTNKYCLFAGGTLQQYINDCIKYYLNDKVFFKDGYATEIQYLQRLRDNNNSGFYLDDGLSLRKIHHLERLYNNGNPFPKALQELLLLAGFYSGCLDFADFSNPEIYQNEERKSFLEYDNLVISRPHFFVVYGHGLFVFLDEGDNPPVNQILEEITPEIYYRSTGYTLQDLIDNKIQDYLDTTVPYLAVFNNEKMEITYLQKLFLNPTDDLFSNKGLSLSEIERLELLFNNGNPFPKVLKELLFLAGHYCNDLAFGLGDHEESHNDMSRDLRVIYGITIDRPHFFVDLTNPDNPFFVFLDEGDNPQVYEIKYDIPDEHYVNLKWTLQDLVNGFIETRLNGYR